MEHEVFVPVAAERLRQVLADPERVAGAVPGLQRDAEEAAAPLSGRLKVRAGGHTVTYRCAARAEGRADGTYVIEGEGAEVRGSGSVKLALTVRLVPAAGGTTVVFGGTAAAEGRITESSPQAVESAVRRLLERFAEGLAEAAPADSGPAGAAGAAGAPTVFDTEVPPPSLDPLSDDLDGDSLDGDDLDDGIDDDDLDGIEVDDAVDVEDDDELRAIDGIDDVSDLDVPPAEAAHARRTMIGRSAEEVDHAPPRGRYAPAPAPEALSAGATLRWAAPAAALAVASAIVVGRALRRRR
ncbi:SRPBCC family protein [Streptomyces sp. G44]|uniref:SRPBCC family protein n=1 Tax=Streptomyces sp. G44 TaxID=2807632 RepID=UPI001961FAFA|nr:SRPBCC family protein [Streptomyces sp. G44]MBM7173605.1 SRPBCC family protein [Streptomyces sp. G44]